MKKQFLIACTLITAMSGVFLRADSNPMATRIYGNQYTPAVTDSQSAATVGTIDTLFGATGSLSLSSIISGGQAAGVETLPNGNFLVVLADPTFGVASRVVQYNAEGIVQSLYGSSTGVALGDATTSQVPLATMLDEQGRILVAGGNGEGWIYRVSTAGVATAFTTGSAFSYIAGLAQQTSGKIIAVGFNGTNAMVARYNLNGTIDATFGSSGYVILDGTSSLPTSPEGLYSVVVGSDNTIYLLVFDNTNATYLVKLNTNGSFVDSYAVSYLNSGVPSSSKIAFDQTGNLILATERSDNLYVTALTTTGDPVVSFTNFATGSGALINFYTLKSMITSSGNSDSYIYLVGSNTSTSEMIVIRLTSAGALDTAFNGTGFNQFQVAGVSISASTILSAAIAPDGQLYLPGYQVVSGTITPYVSRINNSQYVYQIAQYPLGQEQGTLDQTFGNQLRQTYSGVVSPFNGQYGASLMQKAQNVIEITTTSGAAPGVPPVSDILVGMSGYTNSSANSNMMLSWLTSDGDIDTTVNDGGFLTLTRDTTAFGSDSNEILTSMLQGLSGSVYVAGYAQDGTASGAFLRLYTTSSTTDNLIPWSVGDSAWQVNETTPGYQGISVGYQASTGNALLFVAENATDGHISAYSLGGSAAPYGPTGNGTIPSTYTYPTGATLHMGPCYGGLITEGDNLIVAYKDSADNKVKAVAFNPDASDLIGSFGNAGVSVPLFGGLTTIAADNIRICFNSNDDIVVAASFGGNIFVTLLDKETGQIDPVFAGGNEYLTISVAGSTSLQLKNIVGVSNTAPGTNDSTTLINFYDNATDDTMYLARVTLAGALDITFNSQGLQPGILPIQIGDRVADYTARIATSALVQSTAGANQGNIVMSGYEQVTSNDVTPMVMRSYGQAGTTEIVPYPIIDTGVPGTFDAAYDLESLLGVGAADVVFVYPGGNVNQGKILVGVDNGTTSLVARIDLSTQQLDTTFATSGIYTVVGSLTGISSLSIDADNNIILAGTGSQAWAQRLTPNGTNAVSFDIPAGVTAVNQVLQQTSGRYILAGNTSTDGILVAFQDAVVSPATSLEIDPTFNPVGQTPGSYVVGSTGLYNIAINSDDTILAVYKDTNLVVAKITADGSGLDASFNSGSLLSVSGITPDSSSVCRVGIASDLGKVVVAASTGSGTEVQIQRFLVNGATDSSWNSNGSVQTITNLGTAGITLADMMQTTANQTIFLGYNTAGGNGLLFAGRLDASGDLDTTWNPDATGSDTAGVLTFATNSVTQMNGSAISINGTILAVGQQVGGTTGHPILIAIYGDNFVTQYAQDPLAEPAGVLDTTIPNGSTGAWNMSAATPAGISLSGVPAKIAIYGNDSNGAVMIASSNGTDSYVTMLQADLSVDTSYAPSYSNSGVVTLAGQANIVDMYLSGNIASDTLLPILVTGNNAGAMWGATISADGSDVTYLADTTDLTQGNVIRQTSNGRILVAGFDGLQGVVAAFGSVTSGGVYPVDTSFGNGNGTGIYSTGITHSIYAMAVDNLDRIYLAYKEDATTVAVVRLLANGTAVDETFSAAFTAGTAYSDTQIRLALDMEHDQIIVAAQDGTSTNNNIRVCRFSTINGISNGLQSISIFNTVLNLADLFIDGLENIYVIGSTGGGNAVVARIASTSPTMIALDTTYGTAGIANVAAGAMTTVTAGAYNPDRRTYLVGYNGTTAYMARLYGDVYTSEVSEAITTAAVGSLDTSLQPDNIGAINLAGQAGWSGLAGSYVARAVIMNPNNDGTAYIAFGNGVDVIVGCVDADMNPVSTFGDNGLLNGLTAGRTMPVINSIDVDAAGNIIVTGTNAGFAKSIMFNRFGAYQAAFATTVASTVGTTIVQQKSGRYIVGGYDGTANGLIIAYQNPSAINSSTLPVDLTFGPAGNNGYFATGVNAQIDDLCIDSNDNIYFTYRNSSDDVVLGKLTANGSGLVNDQNSPDAFNAGVVITTDIADATDARIAINSDGNILVGATTASGIQVALFNASTGQSIGSTVTVVAANSPVLSKLVGSGTYFYGAGYDSSLNMIAFSVTAAGALDNGFGTSGVTTVPGNSVLSAEALYGLSVQADGKLVTVGYCNGGYGPNTDPLLIRFFGHQYVPQQAQAPDEIAAGILDTTLWPTTGAFVLNNTTDTTFNSLMTGYAVKRVYEAGNGIMTFVADNGNDTVVFQMLKDLTLNPAFNTDGYRSFIGAYGQTTGLFVNSLGNFYICGNNAGASWMIGINAAGENLLPAFTPSTTLTHAYAVCQQGNGRILLAGLGATNGTILGYKNNGALDLTFGVNGLVDMGSTNPITSISVDASNNILAVSNDNGTIVLQRVAVDGSSIDTIGQDAITGGVGYSKVLLDAGGQIVVGTATATGYELRSYTNNQAFNYLGSVIVPTGATSVLSNMYATSDGKITLVGYNSTTGQAIVARFSSSGGGLTLDTSSFNAPDGYLVASVGVMDQFLDGIIHADNRIMLVGCNITSNDPYMGRVFGYPYATYVTQAPVRGIPGTLNTAFGTGGTLDLSGLNSVLDNAQGIAILPTSDGGNYIALDNANSGINSVLIKTLASGALDTTYNSTGIATTYAPVGVHSILQDGSARVLLVGATNGAGWVQRYTSNGQLDTTFGANGQVTCGTLATSAVEQTLARLIVAGASSGYGTSSALFAYTSIDPLTGTTGAVDTTFNSTGDVPGQYVITGNSNPIYSVVSDAYDRIIFAVLNSSTGDTVDLYRLTPTGQPDITFGTGGVVSGALITAAGASSVHVALMNGGTEIVVVANNFVGNGFAIAAFDNGTSTTAGANGSFVFTQLDVTGLVTPNVTNLVISSDDYIFVEGNQTGMNSAWVARITSSGQLDTAGFNPAALDASGTAGAGIAGIFEYGAAAISYVFSGLAVNQDGSLGMLGYTYDGLAYTPVLVNVNNDPYVTQVAQSPNSKPVGTNDVTLGVSPISTADLGITFFGSSGDAASAQVARAVGLYDDNNFVVAIDGHAASGAGNSSIMMNMFDNDGILNPDFGSSGQTNVLADYENQYVRDMVTFTTSNDVTKAIVAGYVQNTTLDTTDSLLLQYILTPGSQGLDSSFGGYDGNPAGIAFGDGKQLFSVAQQSTGRIIAAGLSQDNLGLLLGYTALGKMDSSFANNGYQSVNTGTTGIYSHAIDTNNCIVFAYNNGANSVAVARYLADGSALDSTFTTPSPLIATVSSDSNIKVALDSSNNIHVAAGTNSDNTISVKIYAQTGGTATASIDLSGTDLGNGNAVYTLGRLLVDQSGNTIIAAYDSNAQQVVVIRLTPALVLDTTFNSVGYITYAVAGGTTSQIVTDAMIHPDGRIIVVGSQD